MKSGQSYPWKLLETLKYRDRLCLLDNSAALTELLVSSGGLASGVLNLEQLDLCGFENILTGLIRLHSQFVPVLLWHGHLPLLYYVLHSEPIGKPVQFGLFLIRVFKDLN